MIVTTSDRPSGNAVERAERLAEELQAAYVPRAGRTIRALHTKLGEKEIVVVGPRDIRLVAEGELPFYFHPSMALVRIKGLLAGGKDTLLSVTGVSPGDTVLDCTAGLCSDSIVFSYAVGDKGRVIALETVKTMHALVREGLLAYESGVPDVDRAMRAIETVSGSYEEILPCMEDASADIVYFDPMFEKPVSASSSMVPLRSLAAHGTLTEKAVQEARRVARRKVVLKDHRDSGRFEKLGFSLAKVSSSAVAYGVIEIE
ncbi:class I SAM-dependent methyltransferase [Cohnella terricola]|uniref:SAM-dependent methyltransferase n=1 Tax=Cohnella terricola TaxID=1289167 RepID=A0A559JR06_9BACL|nr:class I SAM-dependent methyltransferase [Cohnella terricola]TVY02314.1 SAM-dependent methyltransferase [Cohnella terricola]